MSRVRLILVSAAFLAAGLAGSVAGHAAAAIPAQLEAALRPSAVPGLLGPIAAEGRKGWACQPERAAGARAAREAELPDIPDPDQR